MSKKAIRIQGLEDRILLNDSFIIDFQVQEDKSKTQPLLHKYSRFIYIIEGNGKIKIQENIYQLKKGSVISILPWQFSEIVEVKETLRYYLLVYDFGYLNMYIKNFMDYDSNNFIETLYNGVSVIDNDDNSYDFKIIFEQINIELQSNIINDKKIFSHIYLTGKFAEIFILFLRTIESKNNKVNQKPVIASIFAYIFVNSSKDLTLENLSKIFLMSPSSISKYISKVTNLTFTDILQEIRLYKTKFLLKNTNFTLDEIAKIVNYNDSSHLSKVFSTNENIKTKEFRKIYSTFKTINNTKLDDKSPLVINYIKDNYDKDINIISVGDEFDISSKQVNKILSFYFEENFITFLNKYRVHKACDLLVETNYNTADIAHIVGFNSNKTFYRNFIKYIGVTLFEFRNTHIK